MAKNQNLASISTVVDDDKIVKCYQALTIKKLSDI